MGKRDKTTGKNGIRPSKGYEHISHNTHKPNTSSKLSNEDIKRVRNAVRQFNAKITRLENKFPEKAEFLPDRKNVQSVINQSETKRDLNRIVNSINRFKRKGSEELVVRGKDDALTKYEEKENQILRRTITNMRISEKKRLNITNERQIEKENLRRKNYNPKTYEERKEWERVARNEVRANYRKEGIQTYKENYLKAVAKNHGKTSPLYQKIKDMDSHTLYTHSVNNAKLSINENYDDYHMQADIHDAIIDEWHEMGVLGDVDKDDLHFTENFDDQRYDSYDEGYAYEEE